jgi:hypothetical protein
MLFLFNTPCIFKGKRVGLFFGIEIHRTSFEAGRFLIVPESAPGKFLEHDLNDVLAADQFVIKLSAFHRKAFTVPDKIELHEHLDDSLRKEIPEFLWLSPSTGIYCQDSPAGKASGLMLGSKTRMITHIVLKTGTHTQRTIAIELSHMRRLRPNTIELSLGIEQLSNFPSCLARP